MAWHRKDRKVLPPQFLPSILPWGSQRSQSATATPKWLLTPVPAGPNPPIHHSRQVPLSIAQLRLGPSLAHTPSWRPSTVGRRSQDLSLLLRPPPALAHLLIFAFAPSSQLLLKCYPSYLHPSLPCPPTPPRWSWPATQSSSHRDLVFGSLMLIIHTPTHQNHSWKSRDRSH